NLLPFFRLRHTGCFYQCRVLDFPVCERDVVSIQYVSPAPFDIHAGHSLPECSFLQGAVRNQLKHGYPCRKKQEQQCYDSAEYADSFYRQEKTPFNSDIRILTVKRELYSSYRYHAVMHFWQLFSSTSHKVLQVDPCAY